MSSFAPRRSVGAALSLLLLSALPVLGQPPRPDPDTMFDEPYPYMPAALGEFTHPISTSVTEAQQYFDQGMQLMFAYGKYEAIRSFREAQNHDPECAMCYWGEAWSWGSYLNMHMPQDEAPYAYAAIQKALELSDNATERERAYIDTLAVRYVEDYDYDSRRVQDEAYAEAAEKLVAAYPDDLDAATLYADALFLLEPRRGYRDLSKPSVRRLHAVLEGVLDRDITHPGACHLYIHATESTEQPELAEPCTEFLGDTIPGASHLNHMPSHTWNEIGRWGDSVEANREAWHSDLKASINEGVAIYPAHNLHMMLFAGSYDGQGAVAMQAARDHSKLMDNNTLELLVYVRFGRYADIRSLTERPSGDYDAGVWDFAHGYARLRQGEPDFARAHLARLAHLTETTEDMVRFDPASLLLSVLHDILEGEIYRAEGELDTAIDILERAVEHEDELGYDEPEPLPFSARHWLGAALLEAERYRAAERVYRDELEDHPHNGWSLFGLQQALSARGRSDAEVDADFEQSWARADHWITTSRY